MQLSGLGRYVQACGGGALRHQQVERAERGLKPDAGAAVILELLLVGDDHGPTSVPGTHDYHRLMLSAADEYTIGPTAPAGATASR